VVRTVAILVAVFALGAVAGGAVIHATWPPAASTAAGSGPMPPERRADLLTRRLGLRPDQRSRVIDVLRRHQASMFDARRDLIEGIREVLDADQAARFDALTHQRPAEAPPPP
jgi:uncharacterized membrane protein